MEKLSLKEVYQHLYILDNVECVHKNNSIYLGERWTVTEVGAYLPQAYEEAIFKTPDFVVDDKVKRLINFVL